MNSNVKEIIKLTNEVIKESKVFFMGSEIGSIDLQFIKI